MAEERVNDLVKEWFAGDELMFDACTEEPELAWLAILAISRHTLTEEQMALLAGGPLETLLSWHGGEFIDRVVAQAKHDPRFNHLLGGVWRQEMPQEIWERIEDV